MRQDQRITQLFEDVADGRAESMDALISAVHDDLQLMAERRISSMYESTMGGAALEPAALVNETFLRLTQQQVRFRNRKHFFAIVSRLMTRVLLDHQRHRSAAKRSSPGQRITLSMLAADEQQADESLGPVATDLDVDLEAFEQALARLEACDPRKVDIVRMRVIWSMTVEQIAKAIDLSEATVRREWCFARSWLLHQMEDGDDDDPPAPAPAPRQGSHPNGAFTARAQHSVVRQAFHHPRFNSSGHPGSGGNNS